MKHGTRATYVDHKCRCIPCRKANAEYAKASRKKRAETPFDQIPHGNSGYTNYHCRCPVCCEAHAQKYKNRLKCAA